MDHETQKNNSLNILLVENSKTARAVLTKLLESQGYNVSGITNGRDAIEEIHKNHYDLVIMDVFMPLMNGYEATKHIRAMKDPLKAKTPILALTSSQSDKDKQLCMSSGMNAFILKTSDHAELLDVLKKY